MKKVNFTLVLMLAMLFMGANVNATLTHSFKFNGAWSYVNYVGWGSANLNKGLLNLSNESIARAGWETLGLIPTSATPSTALTGFLNATLPGSTTIFDLKEGESTTYFNNCLTAAELYDISEFYRTDGALNALPIALTRYNFFGVRLDYKYGNELEAVLKRTIRMKDIVEIEYLPVSQHFRPGMEKNSGVAEYMFVQDMIQLQEKYGIFADFVDRTGTSSPYTYDTIFVAPMDVHIEYELFIRDYLNYQGSRFNAFQAPVLIGPAELSKLTIDNAEGLNTNLPLNENELSHFDAENGWSVWYYWPTHTDFTFEVEVPKGAKPVVTTSRTNDAIYDGVSISDPIEYEEYDVYEITVRRVNSNMVITVSTAMPNSEVTGNAVVAADEVWGSGGTIYATAANPGTLTVYNIAGQLIKSVNISGSFNLSLDKGIYIVQLNGKAYKIVL